MVQVDPQGSIGDHTGVHVDVKRKQGFTRCKWGSAKNFLVFIIKNKHFGMGSSIFSLLGKDLEKALRDITDSPPAWLQGDSLNLIKTKGVISAFLGKLKLMKQNISRPEFSQFPHLSQIECRDVDI